MKTDHSFYHYYMFSGLPPVYRFSYFIKNLIKKRTIFIWYSRTVQLYDHFELKNTINGQVFITLLMTFGLTFLAVFSSSNKERLWYCLIFIYTTPRRTFWAKEHSKRIITSDAINDFRFNVFRGFLQMLLSNLIILLDICILYIEIYILS